MVSKHFQRKEFACKCGCGFDVVDVELLKLLENLRTNFGTAITITSGCRCSKHNKNVGGASGSQHLLGKAVDFTVKSYTPREVQIYLDKALPPDKYGLGYGKTFTHLDVRDKAARFKY